jgi:predicted nucleic acid-binding protein
MSYLLDTDTCVFWLKGNKNVEKKALTVGLDDLTISFVTLSELYYGAYKSQRMDENLSNIKTLESKIGRIDSDHEACETFGKLKAALVMQGKVIDDADIFIASCALVTNSTLVTNNEKHFKRIKGLKIENWLHN